MTLSIHSRPSSRRHSMLAALVIALLAAAALFGTGASSARADAVPGLVMTGNWFQSDNNFRAVSDSGAQWTRAFMYWSDIEPSKGHYNKTTLDYYDMAIARLPVGVKVLLVVVGTPDWANGGAGNTVPPTNNQDYADFVHYIAGRFAGHVQAYEIWNEEDLNQWWTNPDASRYVALLKPAYAAIKSADPEAIVVLGGLTGNNYPFLQRIYDAGGKGSFDVVSDHTDTACGVNPPDYFQRNPDGRMMTNSFLGYREVAKVINANEGASTRQAGTFLRLAKPIWLTEFGWAVSQKLCDEGRFAGQKPGGLTEQQQAQDLSLAFHCMAIDGYVQVAFWYSLMDLQTADDSPEGHYGLLRLDGSRRPSFANFTDYAHHGDQLPASQPCGNFTGPTVTFNSPDPVTKHDKTKTLPIDVSAQSPTGVSFIQLYWNLVDGSHRIGLKPSQITKPAPDSLHAQITWFGWRHNVVHSLIAVAFDPQGNTTRQTVIVKANNPKRRGRHAKHH